MALQDLTPQLRTRLSRLERVVGMFVAVATLLLLAGLGFYVYRTAERKGWFLRKLPYYTFAQSAAGLKVGQPVRMMGLEIGEIVEILPQPPGDFYNLFVAFRVKEPYDGYLWDDSRAKIGSVDFLGNRSIEITKGTNGTPTYLLRPFRELPVPDLEALLANGPVQVVDEVYDRFRTNVLLRAMQYLDPRVLESIRQDGSVATLRVVDGTNQTKLPTGIWDDKQARYLPYGRDTATAKGYFLQPDESAALTERLEAVVTKVEAALPGILDLTNQIQRLLINSDLAVTRGEELLSEARPVVGYWNQISRQLANPRGSLGDWLIPTNLTPQLSQTLTSANAVLTNSDARLSQVAGGLDQTLGNLANITGNLNAQVQANSNLVLGVSTLIRDTDAFIQGLKRHWLLRSAFPSPARAPAPAKSSRPPARSPKDQR